MSQVVVVTGASSGVGRAIACAFGKEGARVGLLARSRDGLEGARRDVEAGGGHGLAIPTDVADVTQVEDAADRVERELGPIDAWVNDAMVTVFAPFHDIDPDEFRRATEVTYLGTVWGARAALRRMRARDRGAIVLVGSALAYRGIPLQSPYCGAKHAIKGFFESLRTELIHEGSHIRLSMVQLPGMNTPQFQHCRNKLPKRPQPVPPVYEPELAARAVVHAAHSGRRQIYIGRPTYQTIWGNRAVPWLLDLYLARTGYSSQQSSVDRGDTPDNLFEPLPGDPGPRGPYSEQAHQRSPLLWFSLHRGLTAAAAALLAGAGAGAALRQWR